MKQELTDFERGLVVGILIGEGHFGGDGKQPQVTVRMHTRHAQLFARLVEFFPQSKLYGPYHHGGRHYYQWMLRGEGLRQTLLPLLEEIPLESLDTHAAQRLGEMKARYAL